MSSPTTGQHGEYDPVSVSRMTLVKEPCPLQAGMDAVTFGGKLIIFFYTGKPSLRCHHAAGCRDHSRIQGGKAKLGALAVG